MKKIININLSGRVIPIEESAYATLQSYIESLKKFFTYEEGRDEIINDIEGRIAELMNDKIRLGAECVTDSHVTEIISTMGTPQDFEKIEGEAVNNPTESSTTSSSTETTTSIKGKRSFYRDTNDKMLGGVCAGLANYINVDPAIVRLLFAILTFGGFGAGFLLYILMWIILPPRNLDEYRGKRLFRNPDDKVFGGVASGMAAYFQKEVWVIRLIMAAPFILNIFFSSFGWRFFNSSFFIPNIFFGSISGTFILGYIILWIVLPEATSPYQKMEMRGEKVDVNSIKQNVQEGMGNIKSRMNEFGQEIKDSAEKLSSSVKEFSKQAGTSEFASEAKVAAQRTATGLAHIIGVLFKAFFIFIFGIIAFSLFVALIGLLMGGFAVWPLRNFVLDGFWQNIFALGTIVFFLLVPVVAFITWLVRRIMKIKSQRSYLGWTFGGLWTLGWVSVTLLIASLANDFKFSNKRTFETDSAIPVVQPAGGKLLIKVTEPAVEYSGELPWINIDDRGFDITPEAIRISDVDVLLHKSDDDQYHVFVHKYSRGRTVKDAVKRASAVQYTVRYSDSALDLGSGLSIPAEVKYRKQKILVEIAVPIGKKIEFASTVNKLENFRVSYVTGNVDRWSTWDNGYDNDYGNYFNYHTNVVYTMQADGDITSSEDLENVDDNNNEYEYERSNKQKDTVQLDQKIEKVKQQLKELQQKKVDAIDKEAEKKKQQLKELETQKQKMVQPTVKATKNPSVDLSFSIRKLLPNFSKLGSI